MKTCSYCGQDNLDTEACCRACGCELLTPEKEVPLEFPESAQLPTRLLLDLGALENAFRFDEGFSRPDWKVIWKALEETVSHEELQQAWVEVGLQWLTRLRDELGGRYHVTESPSFLLLCALDKGDTQRMLSFAEGALQAIRDQLQDVAWKGFYGKHVVLLFMDDDDYYQYQAPFLREGVNVATGGVLLSAGYLHIAIPYQAGLAVRPALAHELAHNCVGHLPLPLWLNEGVAMKLQRYITQPTKPVLHQELADQHRNYWTRKNIQRFWAGTSFYETGDSQTLSYSLAEILVHMLNADHHRFLEFIRHAQRIDAGQTAAFECLGVNLGDTAATFLGPGDWRPYRKALVACWGSVMPNKT